MQHVRRTRNGRAFHIESQHPEYGWLTRGWIHPTGVQDNGIHLTWRLQNPDWADAGQVTGDYVTAEKTLLDATTALED